MSVFFLPVLSFCVLLVWILLPGLTPAGRFGLQSVQEARESTRKPYNFKKKRKKKEKQAHAVTSSSTFELGNRTKTHVCCDCIQNITRNGVARGCPPPLLAEMHLFFSFILVHKTVQMDLRLTMTQTQRRARI